MLYINLARSFDDLATLANLIRKLEDQQNPSDHILTDSFLTRLFEEIKISSKRNSMIFCAHTYIYVNYLLIETNQLLIHMHEVTRKLEDRMYLNNKEICLINNFKILTGRGQELVVFFESLSLRYH